MSHSPESTRLANGADAILIPELPLDERKIEELCQMLKSRQERGINFSIVVVAEGVELAGKAVFQPDADTGKNENRGRFGGVGQVLGKLLEERTGLETRVSSLDYIQRGGTPVAYDRSLATSFGVKAVELISKNRYGEMVALKGNRITSVPLEKVAGRVKTVHLNVYNIAKIFFG